MTTGPAAQLAALEHVGGDRLAGAVRGFAGPAADLHPEGRDVGELPALEAAAQAEIAAAARPLGDAAALLASAHREAAAAARLAPGRYTPWAQVIGRAAEAVAGLADQLAGPGASYATTISSWLQEDR